MAFEFKLPDLGEGIAEGEIVKWRVKEGDLVEEHQVVVEVETDKAIVEVPTPKTGKVLKLNCSEGEVVDVGATLITIEPGGEGAAKKPAVEEVGESSKAEVLPQADEEGDDEEAASVVGSLPTAEEFLATPLVRALAKKLGVDLARLDATGPGGRITEKDVRGAAEGRDVAGAGDDKYGPVERIQIRGVRRAIARNLIAATKNTAVVTGMDDADMTRLWDLRKREKDSAKERGVHLTFMPFFMKAAQHALRDHPHLNASVDEDRVEIIVKKYYNIGIAVDTPDGLMVSVVKDVDKKTILDLAQEVQELGIKARERKIKLEELKGSSFTITNYGTFGGVYATPIINHPDVAILGTGKIKLRPWVVDGEIVARRILPVSFTFDHRVVDGREAASFMSKFIRYVEDPGLLFIESS
ncbi:Dihydrolipoamide acyltransferase component of branched-chain alpha-keto acid dehydrogenase complex [hydrothermal vent metagenome]|uniref:Dihydrolipoamide acyltransferase component of branched-chain alpha-keto acid dehydrogenase complex n=1 Tax=hydrothermal vent metagenome TaxID=652676 RepID=A0A3B0VUP1_9ZZZZ